MMKKLKLENVIKYSMYIKKILFGRQQINQLLTLVFQFI